MNVMHQRMNRTGGKPAARRLARHAVASSWIQIRALDLRAILADSCERPVMRPTLHRWLTWASLVFVAVSPLVAATPETSGQSRSDFPSFKTIADRNIFNANRSRGRSGNDAKPRVVESFSLLGTLSYEKGRLAFFDGTSSDYRKTLKPDGTIAGYKIADIALNGVKLEADGKQIDLPVGSQMRREDEGEWQMAAGTENSSGSGRGTAPDFRSGRNGLDFRAGRGGGSDPRSNRFDRDPRSNRREGTDSGSNRRSSSEFSSSRSTPSSATTEESSNSDSSDVLKRLMQQREQELKK